MDTAELSTITGAECHIASYSAEVDAAHRAEEQQSPAPLVNHLRRESAFLVLAPVLSTNYPTKTTSELRPSTSDSQIALAIPVPQDIAAPEGTQKTRRSSSTGSDTMRKRFLRLGPIFGGESFQDFVEMDEESVE